MVGRELSHSTIVRYAREVRRFLDWLPDADEGIGKAAVVEYKGWLSEHFSPSGANVSIAAVNSFLESMGCAELKIAPLHVQRSAYRLPEAELTEDEYLRMIQEAYRVCDVRLALALQTLGATGMRVSELAYVTVDSAVSGIVRVQNKGKCRQVLLPANLSALLIEYCVGVEITSGPVFISSEGFPLDRTTVWRGMKRAALAAGIPASKAYPHNLRHLFALCYYEAYHDLDAVSELLGHSRVETTRIYVATTGAKRREQLDSLGLVLNAGAPCNGIGVPLRAASNLKCAGTSLSWKDGPFFSGGV